MTPTETVLLTEYVRACCPQQAIGEYTPDAWHDLLGDLSLDDCRAAAAAVARRQPFVAPSEIRAEVKRVREDRLARNPLPAPPAELADKPGRYQRAVREAARRLADGMDVRKALGTGPRPDEPPPAWVKARDAMPEPKREKDLQEIARRQVAESRRRRGEKPETEAS